MPKKTWILSFLLPIIVLLPLLSCTRPESKTTIRLGAIFPLTGDIASYGKAAKQGIDLAVEQVNARGGIGGRQIQVIYEDDQGQASRAVASMEKLQSVDKVPLVMGSAASSVTLALCPIANRTQVILITPISSSPELTGKCGLFFFRICPSDEVQASIMAEWFKEEGRQKAAIIYVNNSWGQGLREEFTARFKTLGGQIVAEEAIKEGDRDLRAQLSKVKAANPDALYAITYGREGGVLLRQAKELALDKPIYGADVWGSPELLETAQDAARGVKIIVPAKFQSARYQEFAESFQKKYGEAPDTYASYSYDMTMIITLALSSAERGDALRTALSSTSYEGVTGTTRFDQNGDVVGKGFERKILP
ncbi:MAG: branched-chain amino acid transport system substrate-binding protein [Acidobacteriota bacterium]|jgi:branched-chain amino acid transport system substrate-binding protein|nr:branched-chain amino acid transport system substrate-binding protein [Acidobacteriota bacterium]